MSMGTRTRTGIVVNGPVLRLVRQLLGATIAQIAAEIDVHPTYVTNLENGHRQVMSGEKFIALCQSLRVQDKRVLMGVPVFEEDGENAGQRR
jgi:transcriptional regulator with XRE-family HTH domain